jgi:proline-specific peptidase
MSFATPVSEGFVPFRGFRTWYRMVGDLARQEPGRLPILTVHGGPGGTHDYLEPLEVLAQDGRSVVFYDQLGAGNSDRPDDPSLWSVELFVEELATLKRELGLDRIHLLGQSWGGMLALEYALRHPAGLASLIEANSAASIPLHISEVDRLREELPQEVQDTLRQHEEGGTTDDPAGALHADDRESEPPGLPNAVGPERTQDHRFSQRLER